MSNISGPKNKSNSSTSSRDTIHALSIKKGYLNLIPPLSKVEFDLLKQSIKEEGMHVPIIINKQGVVLDGHHRFRACRELGIPLQYLTKECKDPLEEKQYLIDVNLRRRQLNEFQSRNRLLVRRYRKREGEEEDVPWWSYSRSGQQKRGPRQ
ncbi:MAG TPA: ParB N-terminal domain-containing protein [Methylomirabilota bacterium]|nr:ParB N-terminal domain-containing protein [Methylomirabilota bacterium]